MKSFLASLFTSVSTKTWLIVAACVTVGAATVSTAAVVHSNNAADSEITTSQPPAPEGRKSPAGDIKVDKEMIPAKAVEAEVESTDPAEDQDTASENEESRASADASGGKKSSGKSTADSADGKKKTGKTADPIPVVKLSDTVATNNTVASNTTETTTSEASSSDSSSSSGSSSDDDVKITGSITSIPETTPPDSGVTTASWTVETPSDSKPAENVTPEPKDQPDTDPVPVTPDEGASTPGTPDEGFSINVK